MKCKASSDIKGCSQSACCCDSYGNSFCNETCSEYEKNEDGCYGCKHCETGVTTPED